MGSGKDIVITAYGHDKIIDKIAVSAFDKSIALYYGYSDDSNAEKYCTTINNLELNGNSWVFARMISENMPYTLDTFSPSRLFDIILKLGNRCIQRILKELHSQEIAIAFKSGDETIQEKIFSNMSKRAVQMVKEDMEYMGPHRKIDVIKTQEKILNLIYHLEQIGEIVTFSQEKMI